MTIKSWIKQNKVNKNARVWVNGLLMEKEDYNVKGFNFITRDTILCELGNNFENYKRVFNRKYLDYLKEII